jgi:hypothetical protein
VNVPNIDRSSAGNGASGLFPLLHTRILSDPVLRLAFHVTLR